MNYSSLELELQKLGLTCVELLLQYEIKYPLLSYVLQALLEERHFYNISIISLEKEITSLKFEIGQQINSTTITSLKQLHLQKVLFQLKVINNLLDEQVISAMKVSDYCKQKEIITKLIEFLPLAFIKETMKENSSTSYDFQQETTTLTGISPCVTTTTNSKVIKAIKTELVNNFPQLKINKLKDGSVDFAINNEITININEHDETIVVVTPSIIQTNAWLRHFKLIA